MKITKKLLSLFMALAMALSMTAAAFAADEVPYTDVSEQNWYHDAVAFVTGEELMGGLTKIIFGPSENTTRQMLASALYRLAGAPEVAAENPFTDIADSAAYKDAVVWACTTGVITADGAAFDPDSAVQRQDVAVMLARYLGADTADEDALSAFSDAGDAEDEAKGALSWAIANDLVRGNPDGTVNPRGSATRAQTAAILERFAPMAEGKAPSAVPVGDDTATPADDAAAPASDDTATPADDAAAPADDDTAAPADDVAADKNSAAQEDLQARASAFLKKQQYTEAADCYRKMQAAGTITKRELAEKLLSTAKEAVQNEKFTVSAELLQEAASLGSADAVNELGGSYLEGRGVEKDAEKAFALYQEAAEMGLAAASYNVGVCYAYGYGTEKNEETAFQWFKKAAEADVPYAMFATGTWYAAGKGTETDKEQAIFWLEKYEESGNTMWADDVPGLLENLKANETAKS